MEVKGFAMNNAIAGLQTGLALVTKSAQRIASMGQNDTGLDPTALSEAAVEMLQGRQQFEASAQVLEVEQQTIGTLLKRIA